MIASWIMKRMVRSGFDKLGVQGDAESGWAKFADDGVYDFPLELSAGGTARGKKAALEGTEATEGKAGQGQGTVHVGRHPQRTVPG